ncbi:phage head spike fiber domain-containing protein [Oleiharenicola lentus]|uniref:phage head spike fiber domain-containing protein n=1 Tax=Oleiharenicola lentus TaxID=2508720 RepID=UPI003F66685C
MSRLDEQTRVKLAKLGSLLYLERDPDSGGRADNAILIENLIAQFNASRAFAQWLQSDGTTTNRAQIQGPFSAGHRGWLAGALVAEWRGSVPVSTANPAVTANIFFLSSSTAPALSIGDSLQVQFDTAGALRIQANGTSNSSNNRTFTFAGFRAAHSGATVMVEILLFKGTGNPVVRINGEDVSASFVAATGGTPPEWLDANLNSAYHLTGFNWPAGEAPLGCWMNAHLTSAESLAWLVTGQPPAWVQLGGSQANRLQFGSEFENAYWTKIAASVSANATTAPDATSTADSLIETATTAQHYAQLTSLLPLSAGGIYEFSFYTKTNGRSVYFELGGCRSAYDFSLSALTPGNSYAASWTFISCSATDVGSGWFQMRIRGICNTAGTHNAKMHTSPNGNAYAGLSYAGDGVSGIYLWGASLVQIGALSLPRVQCIPVLDDWTEIGGNSARLVGIRGVTDDKWWRIITDTASNAAGGQAILGGDVLDSAKDVIDTIEQTPLTGMPTTSLGHLTGSLATYKASAALAAGINPITPVTRKPAGNQFWAYQSTTDVVRNTFTGHRAA